MNSEEYKISKREKRGQISKEDLDPYLEFSASDLRVLLKNDDPQKRTAAAMILGNKNDRKTILALCNALKTEKALYSRIAMSEALGKIGEPAVGNVINLLGVIGNNQESKLPSKYFKKKSFPLQRDIAARTLVKIGLSAAPYLTDLLETESNNFIIEQAIDAIGGIAAKTGDQRGFSAIINTLRIFSNNNLIVWKCVRALSGFRLNVESSETLVSILKSDYEAPIIWESLRSLGKNGVNNQKIIETIESFKDHDNPEIRIAAIAAMEDLL